MRRAARTVAAAVVASMLVVNAACSSSNTSGDAAGGTSVPEGAPSGECPEVIDAEQFASADQLRDLLAEWNDFGLRSPASEQHEAALEWLAGELAAVPGMQVEWDEYEIDRWQPTPEAPGDTPGRDLAEAGKLILGTAGGPTDVPAIGAVPFSLPTGDAGITAPLVYLPPDQEITAANAAGRVVVRDIPHSTIPFAGFEIIGHHLTPDVPSEGDYDRPYLRALDAMLTQAGIAGAAGLVLVWDAPTDQLRGYWDPHSGTRYRLPAVYLGNDQLPIVQEAAASGASATIIVQAEWEPAPTRNLIATLPGQSRERIVINTNTDSVTWVQENGVIAALALARYLGDLPVECRPRDVQFALTTNHLGFSEDGTFRYGPELDAAFDEGTVAFVIALEHLGTREILPVSPGGRLELTGEGEVFAWSAPEESPVLVEASIDAVERRGLTRTAVLKGVGVPTDEQVPSICSQGGLGTNFHGLLIPTIAGISGPWSLWAPSFGEDAIDFERFRDQTLALGDVALVLAGVPRDEIAGGYLEARQQRAAGAATCELPRPPAVAPTG